MRIPGEMPLAAMFVMATLFIASLSPVMTSSVPASAATRASPGSIIISEVMYDPKGTELDGEWAELRNPGAAVNVTNWTVSDQEGDPDFTFPTLDFPAGGHALIHVGAGVNSTSFADGKAEFYMWKTSALLSNTGDDLLLSDSFGATVDFMSYGQWDGGSVGAPPADFDYEHGNATAPEGYSLARLGGIFLSSVPTPLYPNGDDSAPGLLITEVHYYAWGDNEFFTVHNPLAAAADLSSWCLTDLEGAVAFPVGTFISPGASLTVAQNATNFFSQTLEHPDFEYSGNSDTVPDMVTVTTAPALANAGDELFLRNNFGTAVDIFAYGSSGYSGIGWESGPVPAQPQGRVAKRNFDTDYDDTNTSTDWENLRPHIIGQSAFGNAQFSGSEMTLFASPDCSYRAVTDVLDNATARIWLTVYEFTSWPLAQSLISAVGRGAEVKIFLEGSPVGGITAQELFLARMLAEAGAQVRMMSSDPSSGVYARYSYVHAKYAVIDSDILIIMSENWGHSGVPLSGNAGNRGWGAVVRNAETVGYFADIFSEDWEPARSDSVAFDQFHSLWSAGSNSTYAPQSYKPMFEILTVSTPSTLVPVLSPDTSLSPNTILGMLDSASERVLVEEFYIYKHWGGSTGSVESTPNLYLEAVIGAARRGCQVRVLLDATYYNAMEDDPIDNDDTVDYVNALAIAEGLDMEAKLVNLNEHGFEKIHNKGLVADDSVLISSINWNLNSVTANRESGLIITNAQAADYFASIFAYDWIDDLTEPFAHFHTEDSYLVGAAAHFNASTSSDNSGIVNYTWKIGGQASGWDAELNHLFEEVGQYTVELTVRDAWGNAGSYSKAINVTADGQAPDSDWTEQNPESGTFTVLLGVLLMVPIFIFLVILVLALRRR